MRGTVLLVDGADAVDAEPLRAAGLIVYEAQHIDRVHDRMLDIAPDIIVIVGSAMTLLVPELRRCADYATSILVVGSERERDEARRAGADSFLPPSADLLYEIRRALILRRSGRRLPWI